MKLEKLNFDKKNNKLTFVLKDVQESFANAIRRMVVDEVPVLAVEDVEIKENSSAFYDEMLALRLGLCPIKTDLKSYMFKENCKCKDEGCARCEQKMILKGGKKGYVYATDASGKDTKCNFVHKIPVVKLLAKQKIELQMTAVLGCGKEHAKWSPGWMWYFGWPTFKGGKIERCKHDALEVKSGGLVVKDILKWNGAAETLCEENGVAVDFSDKDLVFNVESWGQLGCKEMLDKATDILLAKVEEMEGLL